MSAGMVSGVVSTVIRTKALPQVPRQNSVVPDFCRTTTFLAENLPSAVICNSESDAANAGAAAKKKSAAASRAVRILLLCRLRRLKARLVIGVGGLQLKRRLVAGLGFSVLARKVEVEVAEVPIGNMVRRTRAPLCNIGPSGYCAGIVTCYFVDNAELEPQVDAGRRCL